MPSSTFDIYSHAASFQEYFGAKLINADETAFSAMRFWLKRENAQSIFLGLDLLVEAGVHLVTPMPADAEPSSRCEDTEAVTGVFRGVFIGYNAVPFRNPLTDTFSIVLGTVIDAEVAARDEDYQRVFVQTPIPCAEIELIND